MYADYMLNHLHIEENLIPKLCLDLYKEHGTTMAGLKVQVKLESIEFLVSYLFHLLLLQSRLLVLDSTTMNFMLMSMGDCHMTT